MTNRIRTLIVALTLAGASLGALAAPALADDQWRGDRDHYARDWRDGRRGDWHARWVHHYPAPVWRAPAYSAYAPPPVVYAPPPVAYATPPVASLNFVLPLNIR